MQKLTREQELHIAHITPEHRYFIQTEQPSQDILNLWKPARENEQQQQNKHQVWRRKYNLRIIS